MPSQIPNQPQYFKMCRSLFLLFIISFFLLYSIGSSAQTTGTFVRLYDSNGRQIRGQVGLELAIEASFDTQANQFYLAGSNENNGYSKMKRGVLFITLKMDQSLHEVRKIFFNNMVMKKVVITSIQDVIPIEEIRMEDVTITNMEYLSTPFLRSIRLELKADRIGWLLFDESSRPYKRFGWDFINNKEWIEYSTPPSTQDQTGSVTPPIQTPSTDKIDTSLSKAIIFSDNFQQTKIGAATSQWRTNGITKVVAVPGEAGNWLQLIQTNACSPILKTALPESFQLSFDVYFTQNTSLREDVQLRILSLKDPDALYSDYYAQINLSGYNNFSIKNASGTIQSVRDMREDSLEGRLKITILKQGQRLKVSCNNRELFDVPHFFEAGKVFNAIHWVGSIPPKNSIYITNVEISALDVFVKAK